MPLHVLDIPSRFRPPFPFPYPGHQRGPMLEEYVHAELARMVRDGRAGRVDGDWTFVPVYWTSYAVQASLKGRWRRAWDWKRLGWQLRRSLRDDVHYFTVSQHDDGLTQRGTFLPCRPILEFSAGGTGDVPLPLLCDPHPAVVRRRDIRASFVGAVRHPTHKYPCRDAMSAALAGRSEYAIVEVPAAWNDDDALQQQARQSQFVEVMCRSVFALCPRGYGKTSFRLYEAMQLGCVPVYIFDEPWLPYTDELDWREFCVLVPLTEAPRLHEILAAISADQIAAMRRRARELWADYFTLAGVVRQVLKRLSRPVARAAAA